MPKRIQITRNQPWRAANPVAVIVDRTTKWGNPFMVGEPLPDVPDQLIDAENACQCFEIFTMPELPVHELKGKDLACWCPLPAQGPRQACAPCQVDVLLKHANRCGPEVGDASVY
ncbi:DUF4326 domain-containing protein [uncultured Roseibium sp.]|uniref:DUF4326 domain-containing protein n=1 Tax=uncultured Roseibium sp. TaxID=1936171 RepID=UPI0026275C20|nr:DUF4326 domain-containing protein [uncultured Roseibium sp.]